MQLSNKDSFLSCLSIYLQLNLQLKRIQEFLTRFRNEIEQEDDNAK
jgi:hypothetical protein